MRPAKAGVDQLSFHRPGSKAVVCNHSRVDTVQHVRLSGDVEGDYVVLQHHAGGVLRIAPEQPEGRLKVVALKKTSLACPSQWEGVLETRSTRSP